MCPIGVYSGGGGMVRECHFPSQPKRETGVDYSYKSKDFVGVLDQYLTDIKEEKFMGTRRNDVAELKLLIEAYESSKATNEVDVTREAGVVLATRIKKLIGKYTPIFTSRLFNILVDYYYRLANEKAWVIQEVKTYTEMGEKSSQTDFFKIPNAMETDKDEKQNDVVKKQIATHDEEEECVLVFNLTL